MPTNVHPINPDMTPLTAQDLAVPALLVLEMLDSGEFKCGPGRCARCHDRTNILYGHRRRLRPVGACVSCVMARVIEQAEAAPVDE